MVVFVIKLRKRRGYRRYDENYEMKRRPINSKRSEWRLLRRQTGRPAAVGGSERQDANKGAQGQPKNAKQRSNRERRD
jgi:hypothetical protein